MSIDFCRGRLLGEWIFLFILSTFYIHVPTNVKSNCWNLPRMAIQIITTRLNNRECRSDYIMEDKTHLVPSSRIRPLATAVEAPLHPALSLASRLMLLVVAPLEYPLSVSSHICHRSSIQAWDSSVLEHNFVISVIRPDPRRCLFNMGGGGWQTSNYKILPV